MQGNHPALTQGLKSSNKLQESYPSCTVTIYNAGTTSLSPIYGDNLGTPKGNPFTSDVNGWWFFYANNGRYDVVFSDPNISIPYTQGDYLLCDPADPTGAFSCTGGGGGSTPACSTTVQGSLSVTPQTCAGEKALQGIVGNPSTTNFNVIPAPDQTGWNFYSGVASSNFTFSGFATGAESALESSFNGVGSLNQAGFWETPNYDNAMAIVNQDNTGTAGSVRRGLDVYGVMTGGTAVTFVGAHGTCEQRAGTISESCDGVAGNAIQYGGTAVEVDSLLAGQVSTTNTTTYGVGLTISSIASCGATNCLAWMYPDRGSLASSSFMTPDGSIQIGNTGAAISQNIRGLRIVPTTFNGLPTCGSNNEGDLMAITDSTVNTFGTTITGGGSNHVLGYCDGTSWKVAGI